MKKNKDLKNLDLQNLDVAIDKLSSYCSDNKKKFSESVDIAIILGIDPKQSNQSIKGSVALPHGSGKKIKILVLTPNEDQKKLLEIGATYVGGEDLIEKIKNGFDDFDTCLTTPDFMPKVSKVARKLGPKGIMPNAKNGTVTEDLETAVKQAVKGKINFKNDKFAIVHCMAGKINFPATQLLDNIKAIVKSISELKPESSKGKFIKKMFISSTMGRSYEIDVNSLNLGR
jgi:large subunit ribosomal protein L1